MFSSWSRKARERAVTTGWARAAGASAAAHDLPRGLLRGRVAVVLALGLAGTGAAGAVRAAMTRARLRPGRITPAVWIRPPDPAPGYREPGRPPRRHLTGGRLMPPAARPRQARPRTTTESRWPMPATTPPLPKPQADRDARSAALFAAALQPSEAPAAGAIAAATQRLGPRGCTARMAQEFGDHPDAAARRMRWARRLAA